MRRRISAQGFAVRRRITIGLATACMLAAGLPDAAIAQDIGAASASGVAGRYSVSGIREMAGELHLGPDQRFRIGLVYGGVEERAEGTWRQVGPRVELSVPTPPPPSFGLPQWSPDVPEVYAKPGERPVVLAVRVASPKLDMVWANVDVAAEFSNGQTRRGQTGRDGRLAFDERTAAPWQGARVLRLGIGYQKHDVPMAWFDVPPGTRAAELELAPGRLAASAFATMLLQARTRDGEVRELVVQQIDGNPTDGRMVFSR